jgi:glycogen debranching enzyme
MPVQLSVGPPVLTINQDRTFMVTDLNGEITEESEQGIFADDTRYVSHYRVFANNVPWSRLTSSAVEYNASRIYLTNQHFVTESGDVPAGTLALTLNRAAIRYGIVERLDVSNYSLAPVTFSLELEIRSDFADLFEVKAHALVHRINMTSTVDPISGQGNLTYVNGDFKRTVEFVTLKSDSPLRMVNGRWTFQIQLQPGASWRSGHLINLIGSPESEKVVDARRQALAEGKPYTERDVEIRQNEWRGHATSLTSTNADVERSYRQSVEDMGGLRLFHYDLGPDVWIPAAGVPWFVTLFGRDTLVVSLQNMLVDSSFARGTLTTLARFQATERDDWRDAQPGKILHEIRFGELSHFHKLPFTPYYGTWDATTFYLTVLHEAWKWTGDDSLLREHRDTALRCLEWIDKYGDLDGDGFQEYKTFSTKGYENMGWKDAGEAVVYPDGSQVKQPKALCELQGYVFDAWLRMAEVFDQLGEPDRAAELRRKAADLQRRFEAAYWCEELGFYAFGLDPDKKPIKTIASNPGHCLWSGIVAPERAARVVKRFFEPDMWSGWGIRTLTMRNPSYNPFSYQNGSVWPHDNGIIAMGMKRYGFAGEAARVAHDVIDAASNFVSYRLPELYAGVSRDFLTFPVQYVQANVPQAWAASSIFHFVQAMTGLHADAQHNQLNLDPALPDWLPDLTLRGVKVGQDRIDLRFWREGDKTRWDVLNQVGKVKVQQKAWLPWSIGAAPAKKPGQEEARIPTERSEHSRKPGS